MPSSPTSSKTKTSKNISPPSLRIRQLADASRYFLSELSSLLGYVTSGVSSGVGWAQYEDMEKRRLTYEKREYLRLLARHKYLETKRIGERLMIRLTEKGWQQVLRDQICGTTRKCKEGVCIVIFDVPESERKIRDTLRAVLSDLGFNMVQKSVWVTNRDVVKPLCALLQGRKLDQWVRIMLGKERSASMPRNIAVRATAQIHALKTSKQKAL